MARKRSPRGGPRSHGTLDGLWPAAAGLVNVRMDLSTGTLAIRSGKHPVRRALSLPAWDVDPAIDLVHAA
jgi:hypothetical protein